MSLIKKLSNLLPKSINDFIKKQDLFCYLLPDKYLISDDIVISKKLNHDNFLDVIQEIGNKKGFKVLEIGSREVTGKSSARAKFSNAEYIGFDYYDGDNVDIVGDVHKLSTYFQEEEFDLIYSSACFEHFAMPWIVAPEIAKCLKTGGHLAIETHFSYSSHERPWHFYQYSDMALKTLFSPLLGFECIDAGVYNHIKGRFSSFSSKYLRNKIIPDLFCHANFLGKKVQNVPDFDWNNVDIDSLVNGTKYPEPSEK